MEWKLIPSTDFYEASHRGKVRSLPGGHRKGIVLKPGRSSNGYPTVNVYLSDGTRVNRPVHIFVLTAHAGECPPGMVARHLNDIKTDNRWPENLAWGTWPENAQDALANQRNHNAGKQACDQGHPFVVKHRRDGSQYRECAECPRARSREWARQSYTPRPPIPGRVCAECEGPLPETVRADARYCSAVCRNRARYKRDRVA